MKNRFISSGPDLMTVKPPSSDFNEGRRAREADRPLKSGASKDWVMGWKDKDEEIKDARKSRP